MLALPEGLGERDVIYWDPEGNVRLPPGRAAWVLSVVHPNECRWFMQALETRADLSQVKGWPLATPLPREVPPNRRELASGRRRARKVGRERAPKTVSGHRL